MAYVPRKGKSPDTIHKIRDELDTVLAGAASRTMQRVAGLRNEELSEAASPGHVRATALVKQLQANTNDDAESAVDQLLNLAKYMDIRKAMFDVGAIELLVALLLRKYLDTQHPKPFHRPYDDRPYRGIISLLHYFASDSSVSCYHYTDRIAEAGAIPQLLVLLRDRAPDMALQTVTETVGVLEILAKRHAVDFNCIERLISHIREETPFTMYGSTIYPEEAACMLYYLARNDADRQRAIVEAEGLYSRLVKMTRQDGGSSGASRMLYHLFEPPVLASKVTSLESKVASLERRLSRYEGVVDVTGDGADAPPVANKLREEHNRATNARLVKVKTEKAEHEERADEQGTNAMYLHTQKSELQRLVSDAANALLDSDADVPTKEVDDDATPFYYILESHRDDGKQTVLWNVEADRAMTLAEGIAWIQNNRPNKRQRRR